MGIKLYTVASNGPISCLADIQGPLTTPTKMEFIDVLNMVKKGYVVYEHNPADLTEKVRVTINNINSIKFTSSRTAAVNRRNINEEKQVVDNSMKVAVLNKDSEKKEKPEPLKAPENNNSDKAKYDNSKNKPIKGNDFSK